MARATTARRRVGAPAPSAALTAPAGGLVRRIGAHVPTAGGLAKSLPYADTVKAEVMQVYVSNPRGWALSAGDPAQDSAFRAGRAERGISAYIHASLLVNLGSPTPETVRRSMLTLAHALERGAAIGAAGVVFHAGSVVTVPADTASARSELASPAAASKKSRPHARALVDIRLRQVREALLPLLDRAAATGGPKVLVEPSAGGGLSLAARVEDLGPYLDAVDRHPWLGVCFDTCHAWAAGHDLASPGGMTATLDALVAACGPDKLWLVHANDSKDPCGSTRDRHENIGKGMIGGTPFGELLGHPATAGVPVIVETPSEGSAGHAADIATLKQVRPPLS